MKKMLRGLLIDVEHGIAEEREIQNNLDSFYEVLVCDTIDIVNRKIGKRRYEIICDDEALLKTGATPSAIKDNNELMLFGNLFIVNGTDEDGNLTSLSKEALNTLKKHLIYVTTNYKRIPFPIIKDMNY